jgi:ankyrin repeat protein
MIRKVIGGLSIGILGALCAGTLTAAGSASADGRLIDAVLQGDRTVVQQLLAAGSDVNAARGDGLTPLHAATMAGDLDLARMLITAGAHVDATTTLVGSTPLDLAAKNGRADLVDLLLKHGAHANAADRLGTTPLMLAAESGNAEAVMALLAAGADPNAAEHAHGETALMFAAAYGRTAAVKALLAHGADWRPTTTLFDWTKLPKDDPRLASGDAHPAKEAKGSTGPAKPAAEEDETPDEKKPDGNKQAARPPSGIEQVGTQGGLTALMFAARQGHLESVQALVESGADVNEIDPGDHTTPLMIAIINGRFDVAMYLVQHGADANLAQKNGAAPLYGVLNTRWAPVSEYPNPYDYAQQETDYLQLMTALLDHGANPNARLTEKIWYTSPNNDQSGIDETGATPFWLAAYSADVPAMKLLVAHGADPNLATINPGARRQYPPDDSAHARDFSGLPPVPRGGPSITPLLAAAGEGYGWSFTSNHHRYAPTGMLAAVKYLVEDLQADVNARDADGNTALHNAAARGDNAMILYLVSKGADVKALNRQGQSVADMANGPMQRVQPFPQTLTLLARLGAQVLHACVSC